jgi:FkbM family methyltransferase
MAGVGKLKSLASSGAFYGRRVVSLDTALLRLTSLPPRIRMQLVREQYAAMVRLAAGRGGGTIQVGDALVEITDAFDLGTVLSSIVDVGWLAGQLDLPGEAVVLDVGANIGQFCLATKLLWPGARVRSYEPDPEVAARLAANTKGLAGVETFAIGLGESSGKLPWHPHKRSVLSSFRPRSDSLAGDQGDEILLAVERLDSEAADLDRVDLLKVDVEGYEYEVLAGAREVLKRTRWLLVETSLVQDRGPSNLELFDVIRQAAPAAGIVSVGRSYGATTAKAAAVDVLVDLQPPAAE